ncbi:MAG TPA: DinB family protein [Arachidicoccus sp.]|nr:DinB family protein [Arachidicoccus sp.]
MEDSKITHQIAHLFKGVYYGGSWTEVNFKEVLADISWQQASAKKYTLNTIAALVHHTDYYVHVVSRRLQGDALKANESNGFDVAPINNDTDWKNLLRRFWDNADGFMAFLEDLPDSRLWTDFSEETYGNYYRNIHGLIEHAHYHLGQIVLIKKLLV